MRPRAWDDSVAGRLGEGGLAAVAMDGGEQLVGYL